MSVDGKNEVESCDISHLVSPYMDSQMLLYLLRWFRDMGIYNSESLESTEINILKTTQLYEEMKKTYPQPLSDVIASENENSEKVILLSNSLNSLIAALRKWKETHDESSRSLKRKSLIELQQWYFENEESPDDNNLDQKENTTEEVNEDSQVFPSNPVQMLIKLSRLYYLSGRYKDSQSILDIILKIIPECTNIEVPLVLRIECYFGSIANGIVSNLSNQNDPIETSTYLNYFQLADDTLSREFHKINPIQIYLYKSWLLHWSLFPLFTQYFKESSFVNSKNYPNSSNPTNSNGLSPNNLNSNASNSANSTSLNINNNIWGPFLDWFASERNFQVISIICPHLLRYLACFGIIMRRNRDILENIVNIISFHRSGYKDPFTELLFNLLVEFDFENSQKVLSDCTSVIQYDYFLQPIQRYIEENARLLIFEIYCRIHKSIDLNVISEELMMTNIEAERWIVNLIRNVHLDGKLDYEHNRVEMIDRSNNPSQVIADKTRNVLFRSNLLIQNLSNNPSFNCNITNTQKNKSNWRTQTSKQSNRNEKRE